MNTQNRGAKVSTYLYDGHGDVRGLLNEKGELTDTYSYNAYGELISRSGKTENHFLYTGEYYDSTTNLYYLRARYMNPNTGTFISMDTYQGNMYEPVTLHKYLYANANPVKYTDPSGMFSLADLNISTICSNILQNQTTIATWGIISGLTNATFTAIAGGTAEEIAEAFGMGFLAGVGMGLLCCALAEILAVSLTTALAIVTTAQSVLYVVMAIYCVVQGNYTEALAYGALAVIGFISAFTMLKVDYNITVTGKKGTVDIGPDFIPNGAKVQEGINPNSLKPTKELNTLSNQRLKMAIKYGGDKPIIVDNNGNVLDGHHRLKYAIEHSKAVDISIGY